MHKETYKSMLSLIKVTALYLKSHRCNEFQDLGFYKSNMMLTLP